jgi:hypothetical protein
MKIDVTSEGDMVFKDVYTGIGLITKDKETFSICMRDSGFEFNYEGTWYEAKNGVVKPLE